MEVEDIKVPIMLDDETKIEISMRGANKSGTLKHLIADLTYDKDSGVAIPIIIPDVDRAAIRATLDFCEKSAKTSEESDFTVTDVVCRTKIAHLAKWHEEFIAPFDNHFAMLDNIVTCAEYMDIPSLVLLASHAIARMLTGKTTEQMRVAMNINDPEGRFGFTDEDLADIAKEKEFMERLDADREARAAQTSAK